LLLIELAPPMAMLDHGFKLGDAFEGDADGIVNVCLIQSADDTVTKKSAIHAHFDVCLWYSLLELFDTL
jgi:hypothetical protein